MPTLYGSFCRVDLADGVLVAMADSTTVRVVPTPSTPDASTRADLADAVARLERAVADLTRQRDGALGVALHTAGERDRAISELGVIRGERERLRAELEAAHRAASEGVDLAAADVAIEGVLARAGCSLALRGRLRPELLCAVREHLRSEHVESGEAEGVEGGGHETSVDPAAHCRKSRAEVTS